MLCPKCKKEVGSNDRFCYYCGESLSGLNDEASGDVGDSQIQCEKCGSHISSGAAFCDQCGAKVGNGNGNAENNSVNAYSQIMFLFSKLKLSGLEIIAFIGAALYSIASYFLYEQALDIPFPELTFLEYLAGGSYYRYHLEMFLYFARAIKYSGEIILVSVILIFIAVYLLYRHNKLGFVSLAAAGAVDVIIGAYIIYLSETNLRAVIDYGNYQVFTSVNPYSVLGLFSILLGALILISLYRRLREAKIIA